MLGRLWQLFCEWVEILQRFFTASCCPGLDGFEDTEEEEETENLLQDGQTTDSIDKTDKQD